MFVLLEKYLGVELPGSGCVGDVFFYATFNADLLKWLQTHMMGIRQQGQSYKPQLLHSKSVFSSGFVFYL